MLGWYVFLAGFMLALSTTGLVLFGRWRQTSWSTRALLLVAGPVDGTLAMLLLSWLGVSTLTAVVGGLLFGVLSMLFVQPLLLPQRLLVWRLARENMLRRRRQSALMIAGLVIASAIITSSLVVGDSLDSTVGQEVEAAWGKTDVLIAGLDPLTGTAVEFDEQAAVRFWDSLQADPSLASQLEGRQYGLTASVSLTAENGRGEPSVSLFAQNSTVDADATWAALNPNNGYRFSDVASFNAQSDTLGVAINSATATALEVV
ncbi:MAG: hypothetical protein VYB23_04655, partial [Candidatus Thermoplasmatota archaeon]|nr:hypothetical protein [Candidatus Thermoplasmatota archaeon]